MEKLKQITGPWRVGEEESCNGVAGGKVRTEQEQSHRKESKRTGGDEGPGLLPPAQCSLLWTMEVKGEWRPPQMEQPRGYVHAEPHTQAHGGLRDGPPRSPGPHLYNLVPYFSQAVLEQSPPVLFCFGIPSPKPVLAIS